MRRGWNKLRLWRRHLELTMRASDTSASIAVLTICLGSLLASCDSKAQNGPMNGDQFAHPERDASTAIAKGDLSLRGVYGFAPFVPGIEGDYEILRKKYRIVLIPGTSDMKVADPKAFNNVARNYALRYNKQVFSELGCNAAAPMEKCTRYPH